MSTVGKIIGTVIGLMLVSVLGLALFMKFYLTEKRVRALVLPPAEKALGRQLEVGGIDVGLFTGIGIRGVAIKEADGKTDFLRIDNLVLRYSLPPLLHKKLIIHEILLESPSLRLIRDKQGRFNFSTLALLAKDKKGPQPQPEQQAGGQMPVDLIVQRISVTKGTCALDDATKALPDTKAAFDLKLALQLGADRSSLSYDGELNLKATAAYGETTPQVDGVIAFDGKQVKAGLDVTVDGQALRIDGQARDYRSAPQVVLNIKSKELDIDKLLAMVAGLAPADKKPPAAATPAAGPQKAVAAGLPAGLKASGKVTVDKALYRGMEITSLLLSYRLQDNVLYVDELGALAMGGSLKGSLQIDLRQPDLAYQGNLGIASMQADRLQHSLLKQTAAVIDGALATSFTFAGVGTEWNRISKSLTANGKFSLTDGMIRENNITSALAAALGNPKLKSFAVKNLDGSFQIVRGGKLMLNSALNSDVVSIATTNGQVGLDGALDMPLAVTLPAGTTGGLPLGNSLADDKGNTVFNVALAGTVSSPKPVLNQQAVQKQVQRAIGNQVLQRFGGKPIGGSASGIGGSTTPLNKLFNPFGK